MKPLVFAPLFLLLSFVCAQTVTVVNGNGQTVVEVITVDPNLGSITSTIQTLTATTPTATPTTTSTPTTLIAAPTIQQGPVGQPPPTTGIPNGPTPYTYTTVVNGVTNVLTDVFRPTTPATIPTTAPATGTIWNYSQWSSVYGATPAGLNSNNAWRVVDTSTSLTAMLPSVLLSMMGGVLFALA